MIYAFVIYNCAFVGNNRNNTVCIFFGELNALVTFFFNVDI